MTTIDTSDKTFMAWQRAVAAGETDESFGNWRYRTQDAAAVLPPLDDDDQPLTVTFTNDAWEFFYRFIADVVAKHGLVVDINGVSVEVRQVVGDALEPGALLRVAPWLPSGQPGSTRQLPLFREDGNCTIHTIHVH